MKYRIQITNLSFDLELIPMEANGSVPVPEIPTNPIPGPLPDTTPPITAQPAGNPFLWTDGRIILESGKTYLFPRYLMHRVTQDILVFTDGPDPATIIFGTTGYSRWKEGEKADQPRFVFDITGDEGHSVVFYNINLLNAELVDEVHPFQRALFTNAPTANQSWKIGLINCTTDMQLGLLYSAQQEVRQYIYFERLRFRGMIWEELKANHGGGLMVIGSDSELVQVDPPTHFESQLTFLNSELVRSSVSFSRIDSIFDGGPDGKGAGNSCSIIYTEGMVFLIRPHMGDMVTAIVPIPIAGEQIMMNWSGTFLQSNTHQLQAGDTLRIAGEEYTVIARDRIPTLAFATSGFMQDYKLDRPLTVTVGSSVKAEIILSRGQTLIGKERSGHLIFKYNSHFYTSVENLPNHGLEYILKANPIGVLSYNHEEITMYMRGVKRRGYYRETRSKVGSSNGYTLIDCEGFGDEFSPPLPVASSGLMPQEIVDWITAIKSLI